MAGIGMTEKLIGQVKGIKERTVRKHFSEEIRLGHAEGLNELLETAHYHAVKGNIAMLIFLLKTRAGLKDRPAGLVDEDGNPIGVNVNVHNEVRAALVRMPDMMNLEDWNRTAAEHQRQILADQGKQKAG